MLQTKDRQLPTIVGKIRQKPEIAATLRFVPSVSLTGVETCLMMVLESIQSGLTKRQSHQDEGFARISTLVAFQGRCGAKAQKESIKNRSLARGLSFRGRLFFIERNAHRHAGTDGFAPFHAGRSHGLRAAAAGK
jgi:hypothetical protein